MKFSNLKKKIAYILSLVLICTSVYNGNISYAENNQDITTVGLDYSNDQPSEDKTYKAGNGTITYNNTDKTLTLDNATVNTTTNTALNLGLEDFTIIVKGKNEITTSENSVIDVNDLTITGEAGSELNLISSDDKNENISTLHCNSLTISGSTHVIITKVPVTSGSEPNYNVYAIQSNTDLSLKDNAKLTIKDGDIKSKGINLSENTEFNAKIVEVEQSYYNLNVKGICNCIIKGANRNAFFLVYGNVALGRRLEVFDRFLWETHNKNTLNVKPNATLDFTGTKLFTKNGYYINNFHILNYGTINFTENSEFINSENSMNFTIGNDGIINVAEGKKVIFDLKQLPYMEGSGQFINNGTIEFKTTQSQDAQEDIRKIKSFIKNEKGIIIVDQSGTKIPIGNDECDLEFANWSEEGIKLNNISKKTKFIPNDKLSSAIDDEEAYILYDPDNKELTLKNIYYNGANITLPNDKIKINLIGKNILYNQEENTSVFKQGDGEIQLNFSNFMTSGTKPDIKTNRGITFTGDGSLNIFSKKSNEIKTIETDGYITIDGGRIYSDIDEVKEFETKKFGNATVGNKFLSFGITASSYNQNGGCVTISYENTSNKNEHSLETVNFNMTNGKFFTTQYASTPMVYGDLSVSGGEFKPSFNEMAHIAVIGDVNYTINDAVIIGKIIYPTAPPMSIEDFGKIIFKVYGDAQMSYYDENGEKKSVEDGESIFNLGVFDGLISKIEMQNNSSLTIAEKQIVACLLYDENGSDDNSDDFKIDIKDVVPNNAKIINNGILGVVTEPLEKAKLNEKIKEIATYLKMQGDGVIRVAIEDDNGDISYSHYDNDGNAKNIVKQSFDLDFSNNASDRNTTGMSWEKDTTNNNYTLKLEDIYVEKGRNIILPQDEKIIIKAIGKSKINGKIISSGTYALDLTINGDGTLNLDSLPSGSTNNDTVTIEGGAKVYVKNRVSHGASGGEDSILNIKGEGTLLDIDATNDDGTYLQEINVIDGAQLNIHSKGISAYTVENSAINVKNNSKLKVSCKYGVYMIDGKLTVDDTSTLETDATSAGIVVVDTTNAKTQDDVLSLPDIPYGTEITSVVKNGHRLWTIAKIGSTVAVVGNNTTPADDITGALGKLTIKKRTDITGFTASLSKTQFEHTGSEIKPAVTVKDSADKILIKDKDYLLSYQNNTDITTSTSKAKVIVTGIGDYKGEITLEFDIVKKPSEGSSSGGGSSSEGSSSGGATPNNNPLKNTDAKDNKQEQNNTQNTPDSKTNIENFEDINKDDWYYDSVNFVVENGYMIGTSENKFAPGMSTSRAMINQIIYNLEKMPQTKAKHKFIDVPKNIWYEQSLNFTFDKGIVAGFPDKTFRGESIITREQVAKILYQYAMYKGYDIDTDADMSKYEDFENTGNWAKESVKWSVKHNIIKGRTNTRLEPKSELTRAELATVLKNFHTEFVK